MTPEAATPVTDDLGTVSRARRPRVDGARLARRWVQAALVLLIGVVALLVVASGIAAHRLYVTSNHRYLDEAAPIFAATQDVLVEMLNQETSVRGFEISTDPSTLAPYRLGRAAEARDLAAIRANEGADPAIHGHLVAVQREVDVLDAYYAKQIALVRSGPAGRRSAEHRLLLGKAHFDRFRQLALLLEADAGHVVQDAQSKEHGTYRTTLVFLIAAGLLAVAIALGLLLIVPQRLQRLYRAEQAAREAAQQRADAARALTHVRDGVVLFDEADNVLYANPAAGDYFVDGDFAPAAAALFSGDQTPSVPVPVTVRGHERWIAVTESRFEGGRVTVLRDVSEDRELERVRSDFVATAAHELRTPLSAVYGAVRTLRRSDYDLPPETRDVFLGMIESESERLRLLMDQLLASAQLDRGQLQLQLERVDVRPLVEELVSSVSVNMPGTIELAYEAPDLPLLAVADRERLRQVLANLVDNAVKYSPDGGRVDLRTGRNGATVTLEVEDHGLGIPLDQQERIFQKFYRLDPSMTKGIGGSGLGLYISREFVKEMGGALTLRSAIGEGSTFTVVLPSA
jgi:signal transduction histidine kinase